MDNDILEIFSFCNFDFFLFYSHFDASLKRQRDNRLSPTDSVAIDAEALKTLLREAFGITFRVHSRYEHEAKRKIPQRDPSKVYLSINISILIVKFGFTD